MHAEQPEPGEALSPPPFDPILVPGLEAWNAIPRVRSIEQIPGLRQPTENVEDQLGELGLVAGDYAYQSSDSHDCVLSVIRSATRGGRPRAAMLFFHGGGLLLGDRWGDLPTIASWIHNHNVVVLTADYLLAPESGHPEIHESAYRALQWTEEHAASLGFDPRRLILAGNSAGGGLAAGAALRARDEAGPAVAAQMLIYPMLDDRNETWSSHQFDQRGLWDRQSNIVAWKAALGNAFGTDEVSIYEAPGRADNLAQLPRTYIDVASAEPFRDECVAFASGIWRDGGDAELHVWPGGYHGFEGVVPNSALAQQVIAARHNWLARTIQLMEIAS